MEIVAVMAVLFLLVFVGMNFKATVIVDTTLETKTQEIIQALRLAHDYSFHRYQDSKWGVYLYNNPSGDDQFVFFKGDTYATRDPSYDRVTRLPSTLSFADIKINGGGTEVVFDKNTGRTTQSGIFLVAPPEGIPNTITISTLGMVEQGKALKVLTGSYVGNGSDNRNITDVGFQPDMVIIKGNYPGYSDNGFAVIKTITMPGDTSRRLVLPTTGLEENLIQSFDPKGFTIGSDPRVNAAGVSYYWTAFKGGSDVMRFGTYTGNGSWSSGPVVTGIGFQPEYVAVFPTSANSSFQKLAPFTGSYYFWGSPPVNNAINSLDPDGFTVGTAYGMNNAGAIYHYVALNNLPGTLEFGTYIGDGVDNRNITGVGFKPKELWIIPNNSPNYWDAILRKPDSLPGDDTMFFDQRPNESDKVQALLINGFQIGASSRVNQSGRSYHYVAFY